MKDLLKNVPRFLFFTGKGGVGKTSMSCVVGSALAAQEKRILLISTDPASNLDEVLETRLSGHPTPVSGAPGLWAMNIDPIQAAAEYRNRIVGPYRGCCRMMPCSPSKNNSQALAPSRSRPSTNSPGSSAIPVQQRISTIFFWTPRQRATP